MKQSVKMDRTERELSLQKRSRTKPNSNYLYRNGIKSNKTEFSKVLSDSPFPTEQQIYTGELITDKNNSSSNVSNGTSSCNDTSASSINTLQ